MERGNPWKVVGSGKKKTVAFDENSEPRNSVNKWEDPETKVSYKTEKCRHVKNGTVCFFGSDCGFAHSAEEQERGRGRYKQITGGNKSDSGNNSKAGDELPKEVIKMPQPAYKHNNIGETSVFDVTNYPILRIMNHPPRDEPFKWTIKQVCYYWLPNVVVDATKLVSVQTALETHDVDGNILASLTDDDLIVCGVQSLGMRRKILQARNKIFL